MTAQTILPANTLPSGSYQVDNSLRFNSGSSESLTLSTTAGNRTTWTFSTWFKRSKLGVLQSILEHDDTNYFRVRITSGDVFEVFDSNTNKLWSWYPLLRDTSAWYHIVIRGDSTDGTNGNRLRTYINGSLASANAVASIDQNYTFSFNQGGTLQIGKRGSTDYLDGYLAETILIDGSALAPDQFGEFDSNSPTIWKPIDVSGLTFGDEGFYLEFKESGTSANASGMGADTSGNTNHFTVNNLTAVDQSTDTCTNNAATFNGLLKQMSTMALTEGNLQGATSSSHEAFFGSFFSSIGVTTGKWYAEFKCTGNANRVYVGISSNLEADVLGSSGSAYTFAYKGNGWAYGGQDGKIAHTNSDTFLDYGAALSNNDIVGVALDLDELEIYFSVNGSFQNSGDPTSGSSQTGGVVTAGGKVLNGSGSTGTYYFCVSDNDQSTVCTVQANFGSPIHSISSGNADGNGYGNFEYAVPSGYFALCTKNLAEYGG